MIVFTFLYSNGNYAITCMQSNEPHTTIVGYICGSEIAAAIEDTQRQLAFQLRAFSGYPLIYCDKCNIMIA